MNKYNDLEMSILSCLLIKPKLMEELILEDKHFVKYKSLWVFMKEFYNKFHNFDITLMCSVNKNKYETIDYMIMLSELEPTTRLFKELSRTIN